MSYIFVRKLQEGEGGRKPSYLGLGFGTTGVRMGEGGITIGVGDGLAGSGDSGCLLWFSGLKTGDILLFCARARSSARVQPAIKRWGGRGEGWDYESRT